MSRMLPQVSQGRIVVRVKVIECSVWDAESINTFKYVCTFCCKI